MKSFPFVVFAMVVVAATGAAAQRNEVAGTIGRTFISNQGVLGTNLPDSNIYFGHGLTFEASYARRLISGNAFAVEVEIPVILDPKQRLHFGGGNAPSSFASYFVIPSARVHLFPDGGFSPWLSFGGGFAHFSMSSRLESGQPDPAKSTTTGALQLGGGLDVRVVHGVFLRGEVREIRSGEPALNVNTGKSRYYNLFAGGGLAFRF